MFGQFHEERVRLRQIFDAKYDIHFAEEKKIRTLIFFYIFLDKGDQDTKICGAQNVDCYMNAENKLFGEDIIDGLTDKEAKSFYQKCNCLPDCNKTFYGMQIDRAHLDLTKWSRSYGVQLDRIEEYVLIVNCEMFCVD